MWEPQLCCEIHTTAYFIVYIYKTLRNKKSATYKNVEGVKRVLVEAGPSLNQNVTYEQEQIQLRQAVFIVRRLT